MATETATIRVARSTRDRLAEQARARGVSLAALLGELAREGEMAAVWRSELEASRCDAADAAVGREDRAWEAALADGID